MPRTKFSFMIAIREESNDYIETIEMLKDGHTEAEMKLSPYGDKYWFLPVHYCKAVPIDVCPMGNGISVSWHTVGWELIQDERWFARLLRWLYIDVWLWFRSKLKWIFLG